MYSMHKGNASFTIYAMMVHVIGFLANRFSNVGGLLANLLACIVMGYVRFPEFQSHPVIQAEQAEQLDPVKACSRKLCQFWIESWQFCSLQSGAVISTPLDGSEVIS